jgi:hypothetical protein
MPFAVGAALALVGGLIGLFCTALGQALATNTLTASLVQALGVSLFPLALIVAIGVALPGTALLLPGAYYLTRRRYPVTPVNYALMGGILALLFLLPRPLVSMFRSGPAGPPSMMAVQAHYTRTGMMVGTLLAGVVCGWLFGLLMRNHYERFRLMNSEVK